MSAEAGTIYPEYTSVEIDEAGNIWLIQNHFESDSVIMEMESVANGKVITDDGYYLAEEYEEDYFDELN